MNHIYGNHEISVRDEPTYSRNSTDNARSYKHEYIRSEKYEHISAHGIVVGDIDSPDSSAVVLGVGGTTTTSENSIAHNNTTLYVAAGDAVFALSFPSLNLKWCKKVDFATCFGVYWHQDKSCIITWGELSVGCYDENGSEIWSTSGPDIFTEGFEIDSGYIKLTDFNNEKHVVNLETGEISYANT